MSRNDADEPAAGGRFMARIRYGPGKLVLRCITRGSARYADWSLNPVETRRVVADADFTPADSMKGMSEQR